MSNSITLLYGRISQLDWTHLHSGAAAAEVMTDRMAPPPAESTLHCSCSSSHQKVLPSAGTLKSSVKLSLALSSHHQSCTNICVNLLSALNSQFWLCNTAPRHMDAIISYILLSASAIYFAFNLHTKHTLKVGLNL